MSEKIALSNLPLNQLINGDCIEVLKTFPESSIDLIFADPPYNLQLQQELYRPNMTKVAAVQDEWDKFANFKEYDDFCEAWLRECRRVLKDNGTIWVIGTYHNIYRIGKIIQDLGYWILNDIIWIKTNPMPNFKGVRFTNAHETLIWAQKVKGAKYTFNYQAMKALNEGLQMRSDWLIPICSGKERLRENGEKVHATQKPEALLYRIILCSSLPDDIVLDPFFGSGTTGVVAKRLKRHWIGIEKDPKYIQTALERIEATQPIALEEEAWNLVLRDKKRERIPFGALVENGLLQAGQQLFFGKEKTVAATILPNGNIEVDGKQGSIHQLGCSLRKAPCNGWEHWYYLDEESGDLKPINHLRDLLRQRMQSG